MNIHLTCLVQTMLLECTFSGLIGTAQPIVFFPGKAISPAPSLPFFFFHRVAYSSFEGLKPCGLFFIQLSMLNDVIIDPLMFGIMLVTLQVQLLVLLRDTVSEPFVIFPFLLLQCSLSLRFMNAL